MDVSWKRSTGRSTAARTNRELVLSAHETDEIASRTLLLGMGTEYTPYAASSQV
jgi:hypothetical protein